jgi:hypothetical protein
MARIRSIKPGFFSNEDLADLSPWHRLCFIGLWTLADREGRLEDRPRRIKAMLFPFDRDVDVDQLIADLAQKAFVVRYVTDGVACLAIPTFLRHQRPKTDEHPSALPAPPFTEPRSSARDRAKDIGRGDIGTEGIGTEGQGADGAPRAADEPAPRTTSAAGADAQAADGAALIGNLGDAVGAHEQVFADLWNQVTEPPIARCQTLTAKRRRHVKARLTEHPLTEWRRVFERIQQSRFCRGLNTRGWTAGFDWVIGSPDVAIRVLEGQYDDRADLAPLTRQELQQASDIRSRAYGRCPHEPRCETARVCIEAIALARRGAA